MKAAETVSQNAITKLSTHFDADMKAVNALILERMDSDVKLIPQLAAYLIAAGGKRIRPLLLLASTSLFNGDMNRAYKLAASVEFIHTATLLHDDVVDESSERRGKETANLVFGNQASVLVGDFLFSRAFELMTEDGSLDVLRILSRASSIIAEGEVMQLTTTNNIETTMDDYIEVIKSKTAALFAAACEVGPVIADAGYNASKAMRDYGMNMGIAFQIADDTLDYSSKSETLGKNIGDDFREGKMTAPIIYALENAAPEERDFWKRVIAEQNQTDSDFEKARDIFEQRSIMQKCDALATAYKNKAIDALSDIDNSDLKSLLEDLAEFSITRKA